MAETLESRIEAYRQSWVSGDLGEIFNHWVDRGFEYSDYGTLNLCMDKEVAKDVMASLLALCADMNIVTLSLSGTMEKTTWEVELNFTCLADIPNSPYKRGERGKAVGVSLIEWNQEGKIVKQKDYYCWCKALQ